jgi:hypothetical protein
MRRNHWLASVGITGWNASESPAGLRRNTQSAVPDPLFTDPAGYFGAAVNRLVLQGFVRVEKGAVWMNGIKMKAAPSLHGRPGPETVAVIGLDRQPDGSFMATGLSYPNAAQVGSAVIWNRAVGGTYISRPLDRGVSASAPDDGQGCQGAVTAPAETAAACAGPIDAGDATDPAGAPPAPLSGAQGDQVISSGPSSARARWAARVPDPAAAGAPGAPPAVATFTQSSGPP